MQFPSSAHRWSCLPHLSFASHHWSVLTAEILRFLFTNPRQSDASPAPCVALCSVRMHRDASAEKHRPQFIIDYIWERLMARSWWILPAGWFIDPVSSAKLWILKKLPVTSRNHLPTQSFLLRSCKWFSLCATGDFETIIDWIFVGVGLRNNNWTCEPCFCVERGHLRLSGALMHPSLRKRRAESSEWWRGRGRLTDGLSEWIIDSGLLTDAASIDSSKPAWWITADKQCWVSRCVF